MINCDTLSKKPGVYSIIQIKNVKTQKDFDELKQKTKLFPELNIIEDKIEMPLPRTEMKTTMKDKDLKETVEETQKSFYSSMFFASDLITYKPLLEFEEIEREATRLKKLAPEHIDTDREANDDLRFEDKFLNVESSEVQFRGQKFTYLNSASQFPAIPKDDQYPTNLEKSRFVLLVANPSSEVYEEQMFELYKLTQQCAKLFTVCLIRGVSNA